MIPKKEPITSSGEGRPFEMEERPPVEKNDTERQRPIIIHLSDLNGDESGNNVPKNFSRKAGRTLDTFTKYWTQHDDNEEFDID